MPELDLTEAWWSEGVRFTCTGCGRCCRGEPGAIFFTPEEGERVREHLSAEPKEFERLYVTHKWERPSFKERRNGDCVFYNPETARCSVYPVRPSQCELFPFWPSVMESEDEWDRQARHCPGMNDGRLYSAEEIRSLLERSPFVDL